MQLICFSSLPVLPLLSSPYPTLRLAGKKLRGTAHAKPAGKKQRTKRETGPDRTRSRRFWKRVGSLARTAERESCRSAETRACGTPWRHWIGREVGNADY